MYDNFIFDLYGTLIDIATDEVTFKTWRPYAKWLRSEGIKYRAKDIKRIFDAEVENFANIVTPYQYPEHDLFPVFAKILRAKRPEYTDEQVYAAGERFRRTATLRIGLYPNTRKVLDGLRAAGKKVYLLSNAQRMYTWQELELTGITECFDDIFISSDEGVMKPDKVFIQRLIDKHNLDISKCVMIGNDCRSDVAVADAVGMDAVYVPTSILPGNEIEPDCRYRFMDGDIGHVLELIRG